MAFSGTIISHGSGVGIVIATGDVTQIGALTQIGAFTMPSRPEKNLPVLMQNDQEESRFLASSIMIASLITFFVSKFWAKQDTLEAILTALVVSCMDLFFSNRVFAECRRC